MTVGVPACGDGARSAFLIDTEKGLRMAGGADGVNGSLNIAVGTVFKAEGHREA